MVNIWTALPYNGDEYKQLKERKFLHCDETHPNVMFNTDECYRLCYDWMAKKLSYKSQYVKWWRQFNYNIRYKYPRWAWAKVDGCDRPNLDNKCFYYTSTPGKYALLEFSVPDDYVLLSDYDLWHCCLNFGPIYDDDKYDEYSKQLDNLGLSPYELLIETPKDSENKEQIEKLKNEVIASWNNVFDIKDADYVQAVIWLLELKYLTNETLFTITQAELDEYNNYDDK